MGRVYLAHDPNIERKVALKVLLPSIRVEPDAEAELQKRFVLEARAAGRLSHPGIVSIYDAGIDPRTQLAFIAMEWVEGASLAQILKAHGKLTVEAAASIARQISRALDYAHQHGVVHRDVKPANVLMGEGGKVQVVDFGIAKLTAETHTRVGQVLGTPAYMSPEQVRGIAVDGRSDLFSLGAILYQCLTGESPFRGETLAAITHKILNVDPRPPLDGKAAIPDGLWEVITQALAKAPEERFENGRALAMALEEFVSSGTDSHPALRELLATERITTGQRAEDSTSATEGTVSRGTFEFAPTGAISGGDTLAPGGAAGRGDGQGWRQLIRGIPPQPWRWIVPILGLSSLVAVEIVRTTEIPASGGDPPRALPARPIEVVERERPQRQPVQPEARGAVPEARQVAGESAEPAEVPAATLVVLHENRLKSAFMSIWVDGEKVWSGQMSSRGGLFDRTKGETVKATIPVSAGRHTIEVRITGAKRRVDSAEITSGTFEGGATRYLRARLIPVVHNLELDWKG